MCERPLLLLLLFRHNAKSLNVQEERLAISPQLVTRLHLPHAIVVKLHLHKSNVVILTPETTGSSLSLSVGFSIQDEAMDLSGPRHSGLTTMRTLFTCSLNWE